MSELLSDPRGPQTVEELVRRADAGWSTFRAAIGDLSEDAWEDPVPGGGWTRRKMLNHIRVWHELTVQRLRHFRETGERPPSPGDEDAINAQAAADADLRTPAMISALLDQTYGELRDEIGQLRDDQLGAHDGWPVAVVEGNTYGHYDEHRQDLLEEAPGRG